MTLILLLLVAYFLGSIPFGVIIARFFKIDITREGSGNIGATNVLRTLGPVPGAAVLCLDLLKGTLATWLAIRYLDSHWLVILCGLAAVLGHIFPIFLGFKGGKGGAVGLGVLLAIAPDIFLLTAVFFIAIVAITRYVSVGSLTGPIFTAVLMVCFNRPFPYLVATLVVAVFIIIKHASNISRLLSGTERKIGEKNG